MSGNLPPGVTDRMIDEAYQGTEPPKPADDRDDAIDALQQAGMEPVDTAPHDREITIVTEANLLKYRAFWQDGIFGSGSWMDANGDGATDSVWRRWDDEDLIGWLP